MRRLHFLVEGQTEETVVGDLLVPFFAERGWVASLSILGPPHAVSRPGGRGGVSSWAAICREVRALLASRFDVVTTVIDYYGCPADTPGMATRPPSDALTRVRHVEQAMAQAVGDQRFVPHLTLHELEAWVLAASEQLGQLRDDPVGAEALGRLVDRAGGPELVNDGVQTSPSKRVLAQWPDYLKTIEGPIAIADLGLAELRRRCPHMDDWLSLIESREADLVRTP